MFQITNKITGVRWTAKSPEQLQDYVLEMVGESYTINGIPAFIEVEGWAELACVGEVFLDDNFTVEVICN